MHSTAVGQCVQGVLLSSAVSVVLSSAHRALYRRICHRDAHAVCVLQVHCIIWCLGLLGTVGPADASRINAAALNLPCSWIFAKIEERDYQRQMRERERELYWKQFPHRGVLGAALVTMYVQCASALSQNVHIHRAMHSDVFVHR